MTYNVFSGTLNPTQSINQSTMRVPVCVSLRTTVVHNTAQNSPSLLSSGDGQSSLLTAHTLSRTGPYTVNARRRPSDIAQQAYYGFALRFEARPKI